MNPGWSYSDFPRAIWSTETAATMMKSYTLVEIPKSVQPLRKKLMSKVLMMVPKIVPQPEAFDIEYWLLEEAMFSS